MVPTRSDANGRAGGQIDEPVRFPCPRRGSGGGNRRRHSRSAIGRTARYGHPHGAFFYFTTYLAQWAGGSNQTALLSRGCVPDGLAGVALFFILSGYLILVDSVGRGLALGSSPSPGANNWLNRAWAVRGSPLAPRSSWSPPFSRERPGPNWRPARIGIDCCRSGIMRTVATGTRVSIWVHRSARDALAIGDCCGSSDGGFRYGSGPSPTDSTSAHSRPEHHPPRGRRPAGNPAARDPPRCFCRS